MSYWERVTFAIQGRSAGGRSVRVSGMHTETCPIAKRTSLRMDNLRTFLVAGDCGRFETEFLPLPGREDVEAVGIALGLCRALSAAAGSIVPSSW
mmetsp:Transcript_29553/g.60959  ORF Transcript_29553/g.60959 Transcript_29553/m.60959 type:complete len:95 (+) Transcript_29553:642-926(+)